MPFYQFLTTFPSSRFRISPFLSFGVGKSVVDIFEGGGNGKTQSPEFLSPEVGILVLVIILQLLSENSYFKSACLDVL